MIVDVHAHYHPRPYNEALAQATGRPAESFLMPAKVDSDEESQIQKRLEMMDEAGVRLQVLSPAAGRTPYVADEAAATNAARIYNDLAAELVQRYPERFKAFVTLPLPHIDASLSELRRGLDELGMIGVNMHISALDRSVAEDEFLPIYEEMNRRNGIIFYHPSGNSACCSMLSDYGFGGAVGTSLEDAVIGLHLIAKKIPAKCPNVTYIIPHFGGPIAMLLDRLNNQFSMASHDLPEPPKDTARRFYYDTVGHGSAAALHCAWLAYGADHILIGSDFPVLQAWESYDQTINWIRDAGLPEADLNQILERTAVSVLRLSETE
jgi:predicted TIM-barrel fold metal-dependent hydrolase